MAPAAQRPELHQVRPQVDVHPARDPTAHQVELRELREVRKEVGGPPRTRRPKESAPLQEMARSSVPHSEGVPHSEK